VPTAAPEPRVTPTPSCSARSRDLHGHNSLFFSDLWRRIREGPESSSLPRCRVSSTSKRNRSPVKDQQLRRCPWPARNLVGCTSTYLNITATRCENVRRRDESRWDITTPPTRCRATSRLGRKPPFRCMSDRHGLYRHHITTTQSVGDDSTSRNDHSGNIKLDRDQQRLIRRYTLVGRRRGSDSGQHRRPWIHQPARPHDSISPMA